MRFLLSDDQLNSFVRRPRWLLRSDEGGRSGNQSHISPPKEIWLLYVCQFGIGAKKKKTKFWAGVFYSRVLVPNSVPLLPSSSSQQLQQSSKEPKQLPPLSTAVRVHFESEKVRDNTDNEKNIE